MDYVPEFKGKGGLLKEILQGDWYRDYYPDLVDRSDNKGLHLTKKGLDYLSKLEAKGTLTEEDEIRLHFMVPLGWLGGSSEGLSYLIYKKEGVPPDIGYAVIDRLKSEGYIE